MTDTSHQTALRSDDESLKALESKLDAVKESVQELEARLDTVEMNK